MSHERDVRRRIVATFQRQALFNDWFVDVLDAEECDVTEAVLALPLELIHRIEDDQQSSDWLVDEARQRHGGPFRVTVEQAIGEFFGVESLKEITAAMLDAARLEQETLPLAEWHVDVSRTSTRHATLKVLARTEAAARREALARAGDVEFAAEADAEYQIEGARCATTAPEPVG
jgi:hypothetical protein